MNVKIFRTVSHLFTLEKVIEQTPTLETESDNIVSKPIFCNLDDKNGVTTTIKAGNGTWESESAGLEGKCVCLAKAKELKCRMSTRKPINHQTPIKFRMSALKCS